jgi:hypothetical protein
MANEVTLMVRDANQQVLAYAGGKLFTLGSDGDAVIYNFNTAVYTRPDYVKWDDSYFFVSDVFDLCMVRDKQITQFCQCDVPLPKARYIEMFHDHIVVGNIRSYKGYEYPRRLMSSHLRDWSVWEEAQNNEATLYDFTDEYSGLEITEGITGMAVVMMGGIERLLVTLPSRVEVIDYVGLPYVYQKHTVFPNIGCPFPYALAKTPAGVFTISEDSIWRFGGEDFEDVGQDQIKFLYENLTTNTDYRYRLWSGVDIPRSEVFWCFATDQDIDMQITYNWRDKTWVSAPVENLHSFLRSPVRTKPTSFDQLTGTFDALTGSFDALGGQGTASNQVLWGSDDGRILRDEAVGDADSSLVDVDDPYVETGDIFYDDLATMKTIDSIFLNADYKASTCDGVEVYISARNELDETVSYSLVGTWTKSSELKKLTFPPVTGKIFRFKFQFKATNAAYGVRNARISGWAESVNMRKATR